MNPENIDVYRIDGVLGEGGMGRVYRAWDSELARPVAIKVVRSESEGGDVARERFRREARVVAALDHPGVVQIHRLLEWQGHDAIVMELVEGETLGRQIRSQRPSLPRVLLLGREIAEGLAAAHRKGVVHRDLKSSNIMVTRDGRAKILDFGLAKRLAEDDEATVADSVTTAGAVLGTFHTMAPEQALGQTVDSRADLFSLGVVLYEMLSGRSPFRGKTPKETLARVLSARHQPLAEHDPEIPTALSALVDQLLAKSPADRPSSSSEVVERLRRLAVELGYDSGVATDDLSQLANRGGPSEAAVPEAGTEVPQTERGSGFGVSKPWRWLIAGLVVVVSSAMFTLRPDPEASSLEQARQQWLALDPVQTLAELRGLAWKEVVDSSDPVANRDIPEIVIEGPPEALLLAAEAWMELGQQGRAQEAIDAARRMGPTAEQRLLASGLEAENGGKYQAATQHFQELLDRVPEDPTATIRLVRVGLRLPGGGLSDTVDNATQDYLRRDSDGPLGWYLKAKVADVNDHFRIARDAATEVIERGRGGRLEARALLVLGSALRAGDEGEAGNEAIRRAEELFRWAGDSRGEAHASELLAFPTEDILPETAQRHLQNALEIHTRNEDVYGQTRVLGHLCTKAREQGDFETATAYCRQAADGFLALNALYEAVAPLNELGAAALDRKELTTAAAVLEEALNLAREVDHVQRAILEINIAELLYARGRFDGAWTAFAEAKVQDAPGLEGYLDSWLGRVASVSDRGSAADVERLFENAVELQSEHEPEYLPDTLLAWAKEAVWRLGTSDPEELRRVDERLVALDREAEETTALTARSLRALRLWWAGNPREAATVLENPPADESYEAVRVRGLALALGGGDPTSVFEVLDLEASDARDRGAVVETLELGLAAAEIAVVAGHPESRGRLEGVLAEATATGAEGVARWARTLLARTHR